MGQQWPAITGFQATTKTARASIWMVVS
jgi:hypothetical protein